MLKLFKGLPGKSIMMLLLNLQLFIFVVLLLVLWMDFSKELYQTILVVVFFECLLLSLTRGIFNIYQLFLLMMFLFNIIQPVFEFFGWYSYPLDDMIMIGSSIKEPIEDETLAETYRVLITMLMGSSIGWLISILKFTESAKGVDRSMLIVVERNRKTYKNLFFLLLLLAILFNGTQLFFSLKVGYVQAMHLQTLSGDMPLILRVSEIFYPLLGFIMLYLSTSRRNYVLYSSLFMAPYLIQLFTGLRGEFVAIFLTIMFIYHNRYGFSSIKGIFLKSVYLFLFMSVMGIYRFSGGEGIYNALSSIPIFDLIVNLLALNGSSIGVIAYTIQLKNEFFNNTPFLFGYIFAIFSFAPNYTYMGLQEKSYLAQHVTYLLYPEKLYGGSTIGTAMGAEFYEFSDGNFLIIFILSVLILYIAGYFINNLYRSKFMFYMGALYIQVLLLSPRGSVMKIFNKETLIIVTVFSIIVLISKLRKY